jgi:uncharacterized membrane protein YvlD (DUF360 family)
MELLNNIVQYFDLSALIMVTLLTSLALIIVNQTSPGQKVHNAVLVLIFAFVFSILFVDFKNFFATWQANIIQFFLTLMVSGTIALTRSQDVVDKFIGGFLEKSGVKKNTSEQGEPK